MAVDKDKLREAAAQLSSHDAIEAAHPLAKAAQAEAWPVTVVRFTAPEGATLYPPGTVYDALQFGPLDAKASAEIINRVVTYLEGQRDEKAASIEAAFASLVIKG